MLMTHLTLQILGNILNLHSGLIESVKSKCEKATVS